MTDSKNCSFDNDEMELVLARIKTMPDHIQVNMGGGESYDKDKLIAEIKSCSDLGKEVIESELEYLRSFKDL